MMDSSIYQRPNKSKKMAIPARASIEMPNFENKPKAIEVHASSECHVTPPDVAARMVQYLEAAQDMMTLEPSAGTGNLIQAMYENGHSFHELVAIERSSELCKVIRNRFKDEMNNTIFSPLCEDFINYSNSWPQAGYPRIIMNPPFKKVKQHMQAAIKMLGNAGHHDAVLVALVPITYQHPEMIELEILDNETFTSAKVNTKIIRIEK